MIKRSEKWDRRYMSFAVEVASWSKDPSTQCGCVIVKPNGKVFSVGYNGFPQGHPDLPEHYADREYKYKHIKHAEINALEGVLEGTLTNHTVFVHPLPTCEVCGMQLLRAGVSRVVFPELTGGLLERWGDSCAKAIEEFERHHVVVTTIKALSVEDRTKRAVALMMKKLPSSEVLNIDRIMRMMIDSDREESASIFQLY